MTYSEPGPLWTMDRGNPALTTSPDHTVYFRSEGFIVLDSNIWTYFNTDKRLNNYNSHKALTAVLRLS